MNPQAPLPIVILLMNAFLPRYLQQEPVGPATRYVGVKRNRNQSFRKYSGIIKLKNNAFPSVRHTRTFL